MGIELPPVNAPAAAYVPYVQAGSLVFLSGHLARDKGALITGRLGQDLTVQQGQNAAHQIAIDLLATLQAAVGNLNRVKRLIKVTSFVASTPEFTEQHVVTNGCSNLLRDVFGERGIHSRSACGVNQLPLGACMEIELIAEVDALS